MTTQAPNGPRSKRPAAAAPRPRTYPAAPGGTSSPHLPGEAFDRSTVPGRFSARAPHAPLNWRGLGEQGTTQAIMGVFRHADGAEMTAAEFEQAAESEEERRKAFANHPSPDRAVAGYRLVAQNAPTPTLSLAAAEVTLKQSR
jgi:hypothetical protein